MAKKLRSKNMIGMIEGDTKLLEKGDNFSNLVGLHYWRQATSAISSSHLYFPFYVFHIFFFLSCRASRLIITG